MLFTGFSPNSSKKDFAISLRYLLLPWNWMRLHNGDAVRRSEIALQQYLGVKHTIIFDSGRSALQIALEALDITSEDEVLVQGYTCMVVSNAIRWARGKPVYVDVTEDYTMDPKDLEKKITNKSKVLIIQHTFGLPAQLDELLTIAKKHNLKVIEDCAHSLGSKYNGRYTGTFGDMAMFSFGTDKIISSVRGGALVTDDENLGKKLETIQKNLPHMPRKKVLQYLLTIPFFTIGKPLYDISIGKILLATAKELNITGRVMYETEKKGIAISWFPAQMSDALAVLLIEQLKLIDTLNNHRRDIAQIYHKMIQERQIIPKQDNNHIYLRYVLQVKDPEKLDMYMKRHGVLLGNWYNTVIAPHDCDIVASGYKTGSCPHAEMLAKKSINLPTNRHISKDDAQRIAKLLNEFFKQNK